MNAAISRRSEIRAWALAFASAGPLRDPLVCVRTNVACDKSIARPGLEVFRIELLGELSQQRHTFGIAQDAFSVKQSNQLTEDLPNFVLAATCGFLDIHYWLVRPLRRAHPFAA